MNTKDTKATEVFSREKQILLIAQSVDVRSKKPHTSVSFVPFVFNAFAFLCDSVSPW